MHGFICYVSARPAGPTIAIATTAAAATAPATRQVDRFGCATRYNPQTEEKSGSGLTFLMKTVALTVHFFPSEKGLKSRQNMAATAAV